MYLKKSGKQSLSVGLVILFVSFIFSCNTHHKKPSPSGYSDDDFTEQLESVLKPIDTANKKNIRSIPDNVRYTYQSDDYQPIWVKENYKPSDAAAKLIAELEDTRWDGLDTGLYNLAFIRKLKEKLDTTKKNSVKDAIAFDTALTHSYLTASRSLLLGYISPKNADSLWFHVNDTTWNAPLALANPNGQYPSLNDYRSTVPTYKLLREEYKQYTTLASDSTFNGFLSKMKQLKPGGGRMLDNIYDIIQLEMPWLKTVPNGSRSEEKQYVAAYQEYIGIKPTGKLDSATLATLATRPDTFLNIIRANMERIRWMQKEFGNLYIIVDVPLMELFFRKDGTNVMHMRVVVGKPERQTPSLFATMVNVIVNPPWGVPPTILIKDVIPGFEKNGKEYLAQKGLKAYDRKGHVVSSSKLNIHNLKRYTFKQDPGDDNSLGFVKFNLPNPWDIYLHDTPHRTDFVRRYRALSSGCIRLQQPQEMAIYIMSQIEKRYFTQGRLDSIIATHKTRWEVMKTHIPVHIAYLTAFEDTTGTHIQFVKDIYHRDDKLISLLN